MNPAFLRLLQFGSKVSRAMLPEWLYFRVERAAKAALNEYRNSAKVYAETRLTTARTEAHTDGHFADFFKARRRIHKNELAELLASFIGCDGVPIQLGRNFVNRLDAAKQSCELVLCCAFRGRHHVLEKIIMESVAGDEGHNVRWMLTGSSPEDSAFIKAVSARTKRVAGFIVEDRPLGRKWQTCLHFASRYYHAELYGITGSDDLVSHRLVDFIIRRHRENLGKALASEFLPAMYGTLEWLVCNINERDQLSPQIFRCNYPGKTAFQPLGAGRFYPRRHILECDGLIFESDKERLLDDRGFLELRDKGRFVEYYTIEDGPLVSVKGNWDQLNPLEKFLEAPTLRMQEFTFAGRALLAKAITPASNRFLFKRSLMAPQLEFSTSGLDLETAPPPAPEGGRHVGD